MFIKFLNWKKDKYTIEQLLLDLKKSFTNESDIKIVEERLYNLDSDFLDSLDNFNSRFKKFVAQTIGSQNMSEDFLFFLNNSFKYIKEIITKYHYNEEHELTIIDPKGRWFEALICFNFILTFNFFTVAIIKQCPVCQSFFAHKGKYAKYCSDSCKEKGMSK